MRTSKEAGIDVARLATNQASPNYRGHLILLEEGESSPVSLDEQKQEELWVRSAQWVGITPQDTALELSF